MTSEKPPAPPASYRETLAELQKVLQQIELDSVSVDELSDKLVRGFTLVEHLKGLLFGIEAQVEAILSAREQK